MKPTKTTTRPAILDEFKQRRNLEDLRQIVKHGNMTIFLEARQWVEEQIAERRRELKQVAADIRVQLLDGDRSGTYGVIITRTTIQAEIAELEKLAIELDYCVSPSQIEDEIAGRDCRKWLKEQRTHPSLLPSIL